MTGLAMSERAELQLLAEPDGWRLILRDPDQDGTQGTARDGELEGFRAGGRAPEAAARWLVEQLAAARETLLGNGFQLRRFGRSVVSPPPGERLITADQTNLSVVVGERLVVKWLRRLEDAEHPAVDTLRHLEQVGFAGVPASFGALTWASPGARELPCALVTEFLPSATDGWYWCVEALEAGHRPGFPAELGLLAAELHVALGTPSSLLPLPMSAVGAAQLRDWHRQARQRVDELAARIGALADAPAGTEGDRAQRVPSEVLARNRKTIESVIDRLLDVPGRTPVQRIHGDLHVGQVLSWSGGLSVIDFDGSPVLTGAATRQPAARDVAQLLLSLDQVGRIVDRRSGFTRTSEMNAWSRAARADFLAAYRAELEAVERRDVLDSRLLAAFLVEQVVRDLLYAIRFLPRWAYATIDGVETILDDLPEPAPVVLVIPPES
jgi:maltokinase